MRRWLILLVATMPVAVVAADEGRVRYLEQEVRNLQRQVGALSRRLEDLSSHPARPESPGPRAQAASPPPAEPAVWLDADRWRRVRPGLAELEVIALLGPPTSMRESDGGRVLFYALEIGSSGFLGGSVTLRDRVVAEVRTPVLQ